ncbi:21942_t:CDS:1, partial [Racocetra persica]
VEIVMIQTLKFIAVGILMWIALDCCEHRYGWQLIYLHGIFGKKCTLQSCNLHQYANYNNN